MNEKNVQEALGFLGDDLVEKGEFDMMQRKKHSRVRRGVLIAAVLAATLAVGCAAAYLVSMDGLRLADKAYTQGVRYREDGSKIAPTEKVMRYLSVTGPEGSRNQLASQEWFDYKQTCDIAPENFNKPEAYADYMGIYSQEMLDKLDEICRKYDLKLAGDVEIFQIWDGALFAQQLGIDTVSANADVLGLKFGGARVAECGNFNASYQAVYQENEMTLQYDYRDKNYFSDAILSVADVEHASQSVLTLPGGEEVLMVQEKDGNVYYLCDREDAFVTVTVKNVGIDWDSPSNVLSRQELEQLASAIDFQVKPTPISDMAAVRQQLEVSRQDAENWREDPAEKERRKEEQEKNENKTSFTALISQIRENEDYFVANRNPLYKDFWDTMDYALLDVNGDGQEDLLLGREGYINEIWTMQNGITSRVTATANRGYICQGNVFEEYVFLDGSPYHLYFQLEGGEQKPIVSVMYHAAEGTWVLEGEETVWEQQPITEEEAMERIASFPRIPITMQPVKDYPMA